MAHVFPRADLIRSRREAIPFTQPELAEACGLSRNTVWNAEAGLSVRSETLKAIADVLEVPYAELVWNDAAFDTEVPLNASGLPEYGTSFVGRRAETEALLSRLEEERLITVTGIGGCGKTRLAVRVAERFSASAPGDAVFVDFASIERPADVQARLAEAVGVSTRTRQDMVQAAALLLADRRALLLLDNCEHVREACAGVVNTLLALTEHLRILVASRELLGAPAEGCLALDPLPLPQAMPRSTGERDLSNDCLTLLQDRARPLSPGFTITEENSADAIRVCRATDGVPLVLELAAARLRTLSLAELADRVEASSALLSHHGEARPSRQRSVDAMIAASCEPLTSEQQLLLARLSIFVGGWSLDFAERVCADQGLESHRIAELNCRLVEMSLVVAETHEAQTRFRFLEPVRHHAMRCLTPSERERLSERHLDCIYQFSIAALEHLSGPNQDAWLRRLRHEHPNIRAALGWGNSGSTTDMRALEIATSLLRYWTISGAWREGLDALQTALEMHRDQAIPVSLRCRAINAAASLAYLLGELESAEGLGREAQELGEEGGDFRGVADGLLTLANVAWSRGELPLAREFLEHRLLLARREGDKATVALSANNLGTVAAAQGDESAARPLLIEARSLWRELNDDWHLAMTVNNLANLSFGRQEFRRCLELYEESYELSKGIGDYDNMALALCNRAMPLTRLGETARARDVLNEALHVAQGLGNRRTTAQALNLLARVERLEGNLQEASRLCARSLEESRSLGDKWGAAESIQSLGATMMSSEVLSEDVARRGSVLLGAARAIRESIDAEADCSWEWQEAADRACQALSGSGDFEQAVNEGAALDYDAAVWRALDWSEAWAAEL